MAGYSRPAVARIFGVPALCGLLFGWDIGATSYVLTQLQSAEYAGVSWSGAVAGSSFLQGLVTSGGVAGALIGAAIVFRIADAIGRRRELILAALLYIAGAVLEVASGSFGTSEASGLALLLLGRLVYGAACGFAMHGAPAYIAEMSPASIRGMLISLKEAAIVLGICLGYALGLHGEFYDYSQLLALGRVTSGHGGEQIVVKAEAVLSAEFPELATKVTLQLPDEKSKRVGQAVAAASLPKLVA